MYRNNFGQKAKLQITGKVTLPQHTKLNSDGTTEQSSQENAVMKFNNNKYIYNCNLHMSHQKLYMAYQ